MGRIAIGVFLRYIEPASGSPGPDYPQAKRRSMLAAIHLAEHLHEVPVHLFVAGWTRRDTQQTQALFPAIQNILLACRAVGLGASLTTLHTAFGAETDAFLGLPPGCPTCALLPIGWPEGRYGHPPRRSVDECLFWERYGGSDAEPPEVADRLFSAIMRGDVAAIREIYAPDCVIWHNNDKSAQNVDDNLRVLNWVVKHIQGLRYEDIRRQDTPTGFVQQHVLRGTAPNGEALEIHACIVCRVEQIASPVPTSI